MLGTAWNASPTGDILAAEYSHGLWVCFCGIIHTTAKQNRLIIKGPRTHVVNVAKQNRLERIKGPWKHAINVAKQNRLEEN